MAAVSVLSNGRALNSLRNPEGDHSPWDYAALSSEQQLERARADDSSHQLLSVPVSTHPSSHADSLSTQQHTEASFSNPFPPSNQSHSQGSHDVSTQHVNGTSSPYDPHTQSEVIDNVASPVSSNTPKVIPNVDSTHLSPYNQGGLRQAFDKSRSGSEADSLIDLYGRPRSAVESIEKGERSGTAEEPFMADEDPERSRWIHRDKLAQIEIQEAQAAGFQLSLPRKERSNSKPKARREHSRDQYSKGARDHELENSLESNNRRRYSPPERQEQEDEDELQGNAIPFDLRTPEEIATDPHATSNNSPIYHQPRLRSSSSRIPLPRSSPMPIPQEHINRNTPLPRRRGGSAHWSGGDEDGIAYGKTRRRSQSVGSQVMLDDGEIMNGTPTPVPFVKHDNIPTSPTKPRVLSKPVSNSVPNRTFNPPRNVSEPRAPHSGSRGNRVTSSQRPKSRNGLESRPASAINRPEGDPPWLATMFKPDPHLPPDQQMLPTHAKRIQQEQTEKEAKSGIALRPLAVHTHSGLQPPSPGFPPPQLNHQNGMENEPAWPLTMASKPTPGTRSPGGASTTEHAGYSTLPRLQSAPNISSGPNPNSPQQVMQEQIPPKKKGCGCCIVM